jgi:hypothetical protein
MPPASAALWPQIVTMALAFAALLVLVGTLLNVHKLLSRTTAIRKELSEARENSAQSQLVEAVAQLQSIAASLDRIALRCDAIEARIDEAARRAPGSEGGEIGAAVATVGRGLTELQVPLREIRDLLGRTETEKLADEVRRSLFTRGYDKVSVLTDLTTAARSGETRVQVEVVKEGVKSKGFVLLRDGSAVEVKISPTYEMFP